MVLTVASHLVSTLSVIHVDLKSNMREYKFKAVVITEDGKNLLSTDSLSIEELALYQGLEWEFSGGFVLLSDDIENGDLKYIQFTGLHDKNGKEIYEDDVIKYFDDVYLVNFCNGSFVAVDYKKDKEVWFNEIVVATTDVRCLCGTSAWMHTVEVIGNIHENPELLK